MGESLNAQLRQWEKTCGNSNKRRISEISYFVTNIIKCSGKKPEVKLDLERKYCVLEAFVNTETKFLIS